MPSVSRSTLALGDRSELGGFDCFLVGRLQGTAGAVWQRTAIDCSSSSFAWAELVLCAEGTPRRSRPRASPGGWRAS